MPTDTRTQHQIKRLKAKAEDADIRKEWAWQHAAEVYRERDLLVRALSLVYPSHLMRHVGRHSGNRKPVVCIHSPAGQLAWTIPDGLTGAYAHLEERPNDWDGCKTVERMDRLGQLAPLPTKSAAEALADVCSTCYHYWDACSVCGPHRGGQ